VAPLPSERSESRRPLHLLRGLKSQTFGTQSQECASSAPYNRRALDPTIASGAAPIKPGTKRMLKSSIAGLVLLCLLASPCSARSQTYNLSGTCTGQDMVYSWRINDRAGANGNTSPPGLSESDLPNFPFWPVPGSAGSSFIYPWLPHSITITAVELTVIPPQPGAVQMAGWPPRAQNESTGPYIPNFTFLMIGNNADGDTMMFMSPSETLHQRVEYQPGQGFSFPGFADETNFSYIDLHGSCTAGYSVSVMLTIYYH
jgi:hypothetical protein